MKTFHSSLAVLSGGLTGGQSAPAAPARRIKRTPLYSHPSAGDYFNGWVERSPGSIRERARTKGHSACAHAHFRPRAEKKGNFSGPARTRYARGHREREPIKKRTASLLTSNSRPVQTGMRLNWSRFSARLLLASAPLGRLPSHKGTEPKECAAGSPGTTAEHRDRVNRSVCVYPSKHGQVNRRAGGNSIRHLVSVCFFARVALMRFPVSPD